MRSRISIKRNDGWCSVALQCLAEEAFRGSHIASFAQQEVHGSTLLIHRSIQVRPAAFHLYICFVAAPGAAYRPSVQTPALFKLRNVTLYPTKNWRVCQRNSVLSHHLNQSRELNLKLRYQRTHSTITSRSKCRPLNRSCADFDGVIQVHYHRPPSRLAFAPEPSRKVLLFIFAGLLADALPMHSKAFILR
jgi:hypothetical protein